MKHIFGLWRDARGYRAANGHLHLRLNQDAVVPATNQAIPRDVEFALDGNGALPSGSEAWANDELMPTGTYYVASVTAAGGGLVWGPQNVYISGADPVDLNLLVPLPGIAAIEALAVSAGQSVVFTRPPLQAGVLGARVSDLTTWAPSSFVTVSDQFILAGASGISIVASKSLDSLTASIALDMSSLPSFSAAALGSTVTNQLVLVGGNNLSLANSTDSRGMTVTFDVSADIEIATHPLTLAEGANITLSSAGGAGGTTITINAGGGTGTGGGAVTIVPGANIGVTQNTNAAGTSVTISAATGSATNTAGRSVSIVTGANISVTSGTNTAGSTFTIAGASGGTAAGGSFTAGIAGGNTAGAGSTVSNQLLLAGGSNITLSRTTNVSGMTVSIIGLSQGTGTAAGAQVGIAAVGPGSIVGAATGSTVINNRMMLVPANNITFYTNTDASAMSVFVSGPGGQMAQVGVVNAGGSTLGNLTGSIQPNQWNIQAGPNITLSAQTDVLSNLNLMIQAASGGTAAGGHLSLVQGANITISSTTNSAGTTASFTAPAPVTGSGAAFTGGIAGSNTSGVGSTVTNQLLLAGGDNITLSRTTNAAGMTVSIIGLSQGTGGGGAFWAGMDSVLGTSAQPGYTTSGFTTGDTGPVSNRFYLAAGAHVTLSGATNTSGQTVTIQVTKPFSGYLLSNTAGGAVLGATFILSNGFGVFPGSNITLSGGTNTAGNGSVTIIGAKPLDVALSGGGVGSTAGNAATNVNALRLVAGSNITLSNATNTAGMTVTINGASGGTGASGGGGLSNISLETFGGATSSLSLLTSVQNLIIGAGPNITIFGDSGGTGTGQWAGLYITGAPAGVGAPDNHYLGPILPIFPISSMLNTVLHHSMVAFWPIQMSLKASNFSSAILPVSISGTSIGTFIGTMGFTLGIYSRTGSSLYRQDSATWTTAWNGNNTNSLYGFRLIRIPWALSQTIDPTQDQWMAYRYSSSTSGTNTANSFAMSQPLYLAPVPTGNFGQVASNFNLVPGWGIYSGTSLPFNIAISQIDPSIDPYNPVPAFYFAGFTA